VVRHLFIVDPLPGLNVTQDTSVVFMRECARRGHEVWTCTLPELLGGAGGAPLAWATETSLNEPAVGPAWYGTGARRQQALGEFDVVWMRKDPPYDLNYFFATHLLSLAPPETLVVNDPQGLREVTEKLFVLRFPDLTPETIVTQRIEDVLAFREKLGGEVVVKPVDGCGGEGVFHLTADDRNVQALLEMSTQHETRFLIAQRYLPEIRDGDKRVILVEGEPVGAVLRVPEHYESRANFHVGGSAAKSDVSDRDREICARLKPALVAHGILFAGIDVIGGWLTEVNVTSPTGIQEINALDGVALEALVVDAVEKRAAARRA
jgi:glutathione synthase